MINLVIRKVLNDYVTFINDFKYQFSPNMDEFEQKSSRNRSGQIGGFNYQFHGGLSFRERWDSTNRLYHHFKPFIPPLSSLCK